MRPTRNALVAALTPDSLALLEAAEAAARDLEAGLWLVGGGVRDLAAGRSLHDLDLAFAADADAFVDAVAAHAPNVEVERTGRFGTATVTTVTNAIPGARLDLARLRRERYVQPGDLPEVRTTDRIEVDLARRDFTVNAMALTLARDGYTVTEEDGDRDILVDPYGGLADVAARRLRVLHDGSFIDDATRIWRGARTAALFNLEPDAATERLIREGARWIEEISGERLWAELAYTARRGRALATMERLDAWGTLLAIHPAFRLTPEAARALHGRRAMPPERLAAVLLAPLSTHAEREAILERFHASREVRTTVHDTVRLLAAGRDTASGDGGSSHLERLAELEGVGAEPRNAARWLDPAGQRDLQRDLVRWERTRSPLGPDTLLREGIPRGPALGEALRGLRRARYLGTLSTPTDARRQVRQVIAGTASWAD